MVKISFTIWISAVPQQVLSLLSCHLPKVPRLHFAPAPAIIRIKVILGGKALALGIVSHSNFPPESFVFLHLKQKFSKGKLNY